MKQLFNNDQEVEYCERQLILKAISEISSLSNNLANKDDTYKTYYYRCDIALVIMLQWFFLNDFDTQIRALVGCQDIVDSAFDIACNYFEKGFNNNRQKSQASIVNGLLKSRQYANNDFVTYD